MTFEDLSLYRDFRHLNIDESHGIAPEADSPTAAYTYVTYGQLYFPTMQNLFILVHGSILMNHS